MPMHRRLRATLLLPALSLALAAQGTTTAALSGEVKDPAGKPVGGARLSVSSESLIGGARTALTGAQGTFRFAALPPGRYTVTLEAQGFPTLKQVVQLGLGQSLHLPFALRSQAQAVVEVTGRAAVLEPTPTGLGKAYSQDELETLPYKRDLVSIASLTPGVNNGVAWGGDRQNANAYLLDGMNVGDPGLGTPWIYANPEWFQEVQVGGIGAPAEYGGFTGGFINAIIKRGGNQVEGSLNGYYSTSSWQALTSNRDSSLPRTNPSAHSSDLSLSVGGPILKDRLWYFVSAEQIVDQQTPIGAPVPVELKNPRYLMKFTWQATTNATLEAFAEYDAVYREHRGIDNETAVEASRKQEGPNHSYGLTWTQVLGGNAVLTLRATGFSGRDDYKAYAGETPSVYIDGGFNPTDPTSSNGLIYTFRNAYTVEQNFKSRASLSAILDLYRTGLLSSTDAHAFRFGLEREQAGDEESSRFPGGISYNGYSDSGALYTDFVQLGGGYDIRARMDRLAAFAQDTWTVNDRLTFRPGLRFEQFKGRPYGSSAAVWGTSTLAPRLGLTWALTSDQRSLLKAHLGRYYDGLTVAFFDRAIPGAYKVETRHDWTYGDPLTLSNPGAVPYDPTPYASLDEISTLDPKVKHPYIDEATLSFEQRVGALWSFTGTFVHRQSKDLLIRTNRALTGDFINNAYNPITGTIIPFFDPTSGTTHDYFITNSSAAKRAYQALSATAERRPAEGWSLFASYTRALRHGNLNRSNGYDDAFASPNTQINFDGRLPGYNEDEAKLRLSYELPWRMRLSASFTYLSGERWTPTISTIRDANRDRWNLFATPRGGEKYPARRQLDLRVSQTLFRRDRLGAEAFLDVFNALNGGSALAWTTRRNAIRSEDGTEPEANDTYVDYKRPTSVEASRNLRIGVRITF